MTPAGIARLRLDEGDGPEPYDDRSGVIVLKGPSGGNLTVGYGHNLSVPMSPALMDIIFTYDVACVEAELIKAYPWYNSAINTVVGDVLAMVEFNTGKLYQFTKMLAAAEAGNIKTMAVELMDSAAARELPARYARMNQALLARAWPTQGPIA